MVHGSIRQRPAWARANGESGVAAGPDRHRSIAHLWARAAHDLRYPVQAALLQAKMLDGASEPAALTRTAGHIEGALRCLGDMLEMLILLSRIEAGLQTASLRTCDLAEVLEPILRESTAIAAERGLRLRVRSLQGVVRSHPMLLAAAARSLVVNAIEFGDGDEILLACRRHGDKLRLETVFKGERIDAVSEKCAFVQLAPPRNGPGDGVLGLGPVLLEHVCGVLGHAWQFGQPLPGWRRLGLALPIFAAGS
jgi:signal transduction histidine kinase